MKKIATLALCVLMLALTAPVIQAATPQAGAPKADKLKARTKICPQSARKTHRSEPPVSCNAITQKGGLPRLFSLPSPSLHPLYMVAPAAAVVC